MNSVTAVSVNGSVGLTLNNCACSSRVNPNDAIDQERQRRANLAYALAQPMETVAERYVDIAEALASESASARHAVDPLTAQAD